MDKTPHLEISIGENAEVEHSIFRLIKHVRPNWNRAGIKTKQSYKYENDNIISYFLLVDIFMPMVNPYDDGNGNEDLELDHFTDVVYEGNRKEEHNGIIKRNYCSLTTELMTDGITNKLVLCRHISDDSIEENLLVRIYGHKTDLLIDRQAEIRNIKLLHHYDLAPSLYATFKNGLMYEFIPGRTLSSEDVQNPKIYRLVAREMAKMHKVKDLNQRRIESNLWSKMQQFVDLIPETFDDEKKQKEYEKQHFSKAQLLKEIRDFKEGVSEFDMDIVFSHNDLLLGNVIYNENENKVFFIDFEYASYSYQPFDIANHFTEFAGVNDIDYSRFPSKELQLDWLKTYLMEYKGVSIVNDRDIEILYMQVNRFVLAAHLLWYSWSLIQAAHSRIDFDFIRYAAIRLEEYFKRKPETTALQLRRSSL